MLNTMCVISSSELTTPKSNRLIPDGLFVHRLIIGDIECEIVSYELCFGIVGGPTKSLDDDDEVDEDDGNEQLKD